MPKPKSTNARALLLTNLARETSEVRGGFTPVASNLTFAQGVALLQKPGAQPLPASLPVAMALNRWSHQALQADEKILENN